MPVSPDEDRQRGRIEERGPNLRVVVYAGLDPVTGKRAYVRETVKGNDKAARKAAGKVMTRLLSQVANCCAPMLPSLKINILDDECIWFSISESSESEAMC